jgi:hypothetical protein
MEKTVVEWIFEKLPSMDKYDPYHQEIFKKAKDIFEQQITNCFDQADMVGRASIIREINPYDKVVKKYPEITTEQFYTETFKQQEQ